MKSLTLIAMLALASCATDIRSIMYKNAKDQDKDFPVRTDAKVILFAHVCSGMVNGDNFHVVDMKVLNKGKEAPAMKNYIALFNAEGDFVRRYRYNESHPLWCSGNKIYLMGAFDGTQEVEAKGANVMMLMNRRGEVQLIKEKAFGSSVKEDAL